MSLNRVPGSPDYTRAGDSKFIPELWSGKFIENFYPTTVFGDVSNTDYEGEIKKFGDSVHIRVAPTIISRAYTKGQALEEQYPESNSVELQINKGEYFNALLDDVDKVQSDLKLLDMWGKDAAQNQAQAIDTNILTDIPASAASTNKGATAGATSSGFDIGVSGTPITLTKANILDYIVDCSNVLGENDNPNTDRWMIVPEWAEGLIMKSELKDTNIAGGDESPIRNGRLGRIGKFVIYTSNNLPVIADGSGASCNNIIFGHKSALTFASQMTNMETLRSQKSFGWMLRGLQVYGYEVVRPKALGVLYATKG